MDRIILLVVALFGVIDATPSVASQKGGVLSAIEAAILEDEDVRCQNFSVGNTLLQEFYSPGYPAKYPAKSDCILTLRAEPGHIIRLDFRDQFDVEPHDTCDYDFLEVRDGGHGYSPFMAKYCGRSFPPVITSSDRYLWLRFNTDETIEYSGFRAIYQYLPDIGRKRPYSGQCRFELSGLDGVFSSKDITEEARNYSHTYSVPLDCTWVITVEEGKKIQLSFPHYALAAPNECHINFIEIFGDKTDLKHRLKQFCGSVVDYVISKTNVIHVRYYALPTATKTSFDALFTAVTVYRDTEASGKCAPTEFDCEDALCIDSSLKCNNRVNCKFRTDEDDKCNMIATNIFFSHHIVIILSIGCIIMFGMCFNCVYKCLRKLHADHNIYQARRSRSRDDRLDTVDEGVMASVATLASANGGANGGGGGGGGSGGAGKKKTVADRSSLIQCVGAGDDADDDGGFMQRPRLATTTATSTSRSVRDLTDRPPSTNEHRSTNGGPAAALVYTFDADLDDADDDADEEESDEMVEMVDHACQTRESLFTNNSNNSNNSSSSQNDGSNGNNHNNKAVGGGVRSSMKPLPLPKPVGLVAGAPPFRRVPAPYTATPYAPYTATPTPYAPYTATPSPYMAEKFIEIARQTAPGCAPPSAAAAAAAVADATSTNSSESAGCSKTALDVLVLH